jgi:hypothetical protein
VVQQVADVADREARARAHLLVGKSIVEFQPHEFATAFVERAEAQAHEADMFEARDVFVGERLRIGRVVFRARRFAGSGVQRNHFAVTTMLVEREIVNGAKQPAARVAHGFEIRVTPHECFLNVLRHSRLFQKAQGVREQRRFEGEEHFFDRVELGSARFAWLRSVHDCYQNLVGLTHCVFRLNLRLTCNICCYDTGGPISLDESLKRFALVEKTERKLKLRKNKLGTR